MSGSLKEELLKLGLGRASAAEPKRRDGRKHGKEQTARRERRGNEEEERLPARSQPSTAQPRPLSARQQREIDREREARRVRLRERVDAIRLDDPQAEIKHYFSTGTKIKRIYVTEAQQAALLSGEIVIVVVSGKGRLVAATAMAELREIDPDVKVIEPTSECEGEDPAHRVPDDLRW
jgi:uncharacterized protein YaiL (DUF2058 family)